jgi:serine/threonine protein kinase
LKDLHSIGYVHNDLKLENLVVGNKDPNKIYLIDFGLASSFMNADGTHIEKVSIRKF